MKHYNKPLPQINGDNKEFWMGCKEHTLKFQKCKACGHVRWPPSVICPMCYSQEIQWIAARGKGKVYSFAVYHVAYHPGFEKEVPYVVADVELEEGPRLLTNIVDCQPDEVTCNMPVEVTWEDITEEFSLPKFKPSS
ncbi:MAG: Zn-ribbon domain-containing OB-fold protein [Syntrophaceae bacterium]|nr:Zn-ribbon domain-containing OB-fold protein [Syntrophaceae bacterium]